LKNCVNRHEPVTVSFAGRSVVITGAGGGIGREYALEIARRGGKVLVNDFGGDVAGRGGAPTMAEAVVAEITAAGGEAVSNHDSVATTEGAAAIVGQAMDAFGRIDALINNAGIMRNAFLPEITDEDWDAVIATHLTGAFKMTRAAWPHMAAAGYGRLVFTASSAGLFGTPMNGAYGAAKAGIVGLMNLAAIEGAAVGIVANAIMPNAMTRMAAQAGADWQARMPGLELALPEAVGNAMNAEFNMPLGVYLASEACTDTQGLYSQCLGRNARVVIGAGQGWQAQRQSAPSVDEIAAHWDAIRAVPDGLDLPGSASEELGLVLARGD
jgi:NAD(P)-dependent dehydrogenase (short-subunit alcohol dehydrogenase family)